MDKLKVPANYVVHGQTLSGKTTFVKKLIFERDQIFSKPFNSVYYFYTVWQDVFQELENNGVIFEQGAPSADSFNQIPNQSLLVLDDLLQVMCKSSELVTLFTVTAHHKNLFVIFLTQNFFHSTDEVRCMTRNCHYFSFHRSPRMLAVVEQLGRQLFPRRKDFLTDAYEKATKQAYGYLFLDLYPTTEDKLRVKTKILPSEYPMHVFI